MYCINQHSIVDPYFNIALEEYLFKQSESNFFLLYQNDNALIVGKHQNTLAEVNMEFVQREKCSVVRRISGGGTVYHDLGNLNFCYIQNIQSDKIVDFSRFLTPIIEILKNIGFNASQGKRNEILVDGRKVSGNSEHVFKKRVLHHGTLLVESDLSKLIESLRINPFKYEDKSIKSVQSRVGNLVEFNPEINVETIRNALFQQMLTLENASEYVLTKEDALAVEQLAFSKYKTWEWNYGYSPNYTLKKEISYSGDSFPISIFVERGRIVAVEVDKLKTNPFIKETLEKMIGLPHNMELLNVEFKSEEEIIYLIKQLF